MPTMLLAAALLLVAQPGDDESLHEAIAAVKDMLEGNAFGESGHEIVIEETLYGEEASIHAIVS